MKTASEIESLLGLGAGTLTITCRNGECSFAPTLSDEQLARVKMANLGSAFFVPAWRIRTVLRRHGLLDQVEAMVASLPEMPRIVVEEQMRSSNFERGHPIISQFGASIGLTGSQLDDLFIEAELLT